MTPAEAQPFLHAVDAAIASHNAAIASLRAMRTVVAATAHAVAPVVAFVAPIAAAPAARKAATSNTEKSHKRRAELNTLGLPANYRGSLKAARDADAQGATSATPEIVAPTVSPVAPDSSDSSFFLMSQKDNDDDENAHERTCNFFRKKVAPEVSPSVSASGSDAVMNFPVTANQVESLTAEVHRIVQERARFPHEMDASVTAAYVGELLKNGVNPDTIRGATHRGAPKAKAPIKSFYYFARPDSAILTAHADALRAAKIAQPTLPIPLTPQQGGQYGRPAQSSEIRHSSTRGSAAQAARRRAEELLAGGGGSA